MKIQQDELRTAKDGGSAELERLRRVYSEYEADPHYRRLWADGPAYRFMLDRKWALITRALADSGMDQERTRVLDLGSGDRGDSGRFGRLGVPASGIVSFDLNPMYARRMRDANKGICAVAGDATRLPFQDVSFRIVYQSTMVSSLLDAATRRAVLGEVARVLAPGGIFVSYDVRYRNPLNPNTRPVRARELSRAFRGWPMTISSVTGLPPLVRLLAPVSIAACRLIEVIPPLRSHLLVIACKP